MPFTLTFLPEKPRRQLRFAYYYSSFKLQVLFGRVPVFVFQMGKVGSSSVYLSLKKQYRGLVLHSHALPAEEGGNPMVDMLYKYTIKKRRPIKVISLTREPIGRNISAFFQNFEREVNVLVKSNSLSVGELKKIFLEKFAHHSVLEWFDTNIRDKLGIDVYAKSLNPLGYNTYSTVNCELLVLKMETCDKIMQQVISTFVDLPNFQLRKYNVGEDKDYSELYTRFKEEVSLPPEYIDSLCQSNYFNYFYDEQTYSRLRKRWLEP